MCVSLTTMCRSNSLKGVSNGTEIPNPFFLADVALHVAEFFHAVIPLLIITEEIKTAYRPS